MKTHTFCIYFLKSHCIENVAVVYVPDVDMKALYLEFFPVKKEHPRLFFRYLFCNTYCQSGYF